MNNLEGIAQNTNHLSELGIVMDTSVQSRVGNYDVLNNGFDRNFRYEVTAPSREGKKPIMKADTFFLYCI